MKLLSDTLLQMKDVNKHRIRFFEILFRTVLSLSGRVNFLNLSRYSVLSAKTFSRNFCKSFDFLLFNSLLIKYVYNDMDTYIIAIDASFIPKSGKATAGLGHFWNGIASRSMKGLEISNLALVNVSTKNAYTLFAEQMKPSEDSSGENVIDASLYQLKRLYESKQSFKLPRVIAADGFYAKARFVKGVQEMDCHLVSKLRKDANLKYLYHAPKNAPKRRGRKRIYDGKIDLKAPDYKKMKMVSVIDEKTRLYSAIVYSVALKQKIRILYIHKINSAGKSSFVLLFTTDLKMHPMMIYSAYTARFQIEFIFRDAKQFTGLTHCQARDEKRLNFHFNMSLAILNIMKVYHQQNASHRPFSMASYRRRFANEMLIDLFLSKLDISPDCGKIQKSKQEVIDYGTIAA